MAVTDIASGPRIVNGIDVAAVHELIASVKADPQHGMTRWKVSSAWTGGTRSHTHVDGFRLGGAEIRQQFAIDIDEPVELGGAATSANPQQYLMAALNACMTVGYVALCSLQGIALEKLEIETEGEIDLRGFLGLDPDVAPGYDALHYTVKIKGDGTSEQFAKIHEMVMATSPNFYNVARPIPMHASLVVE